MAETESFAQQALASIEAALLGRAGSAVLEQEIDGVKIKYMSLDELLRVRDRFKFLVEMEQDGGTAVPNLGGVVLTFKGGRND